jgi:hypothetical protein
MFGRIRDKGTSGRVMRLVLLAFVIALGLSGSAAATPLSYTFDWDNQGWFQNQDQSSNNFVTAGFEPTGGNLGGHLSAEDMGSDSGCPSGIPCNSLTFYSPSVPMHFGANYGGTASFDLRSSVSPMYAAEFLLLPDGPKYLDGLVPEDLGTDWHHLSIPLKETAGWSVCSYSTGNCSTPSSQTVFKNMLAASNQVAVMVDVGPNDASRETYDLDNVSLTDGPVTPAPSKCKKKKRHAAAAKKKSCKKKKGKRHTATLVRG